MLKRILFTLGAVAVVLFAASTPAVAAQNDCTTGRYCVWTNDNWSGFPSYYWTIPGGSGGYCINYGPGLNDNVDSNVIKGGRSATQYRHANCTGNTVNFISTSGDWNDSCGGPTAWACYIEGAGAYLPSSVWIIK